MTDKTKTTHLLIWEQHDQIVNDTTGTQDNHVLPIWEQHQQTPDSAPDTKGYQSARVVRAKADDKR